MSENGINFDSKVYSSAWIFSFVKYWFVCQIPFPDQLLLGCEKQFSHNKGGILIINIWIFPQKL